MLCIRGRGGGGGGQTTIFTPTTHNEPVNYHGSNGLETAFGGGGVGGSNEDSKSQVDGLTGWSLCSQF